MSLHYIIDGYNVIKNPFFPSCVDLKAARLLLLKFIQEKRPQGSAKNKVTVVFDGRSDVYSSSLDYACEVIFTKDESADEKIKHLVSISKNPKNIVVVSEDKEIKFFIRALGARSLPIKEFLFASKKNKKHLLDDSFKAHLPATQAAAITAELRKIWLK